MSIALKQPDTAVYRATIPAGEPWPPWHGEAFLGPGTGSRRVEPRGR